MNYKTNFEQYGLPTPEVLRMNCCQSMLRVNTFDAIVCDPPYGIRATNKVREQSSEQEIPGLGKQIVDPKTKLVELKPRADQTEGLDPIISAMYALAEQVLVDGGRLVHLYHISTSDSYWKPLFAKKSAEAGVVSDLKVVPPGVTSSDLFDHLAPKIPQRLRLAALSHQLLAKDRIRCMVTVSKVPTTNLNNN